jgi:hypothetical protein
MRGCELDSLASGGATRGDVNLNHLPREVRPDAPTNRLGCTRGDVNLIHLPREVRLEGM